MTYFITNTNVVKINETSGVIQNFSNSKIDVSNNENFNDWLILAPLNKFSFNTQIYIRAHDKITQLIDVNVVPFVIDGSTPTSQSSGGECRAILLCTRFLRR